MDQLSSLSTPGVNSLDPSGFSPGSNLLSSSTSDERVKFNLLSSSGSEGSPDSLQLPITARKSTLKKPSTSSSSAAGMPFPSTTTSDGPHTLGLKPLMTGAQLIPPHS